MNSDEVPSASSDTQDVYLEEPLLVDNDSQVLSAEDLEVGRLYIAHMRGDLVLRLVCLSLPWRDSRGEWVIEIVCYPVGSDYCRWPWRLVDLGIIGENERRWNNSNWLEHSEETVSTEQICQWQRELPWAHGVPPRPA